MVCATKQNSPKSVSLTFSLNIRLLNFPLLWRPDLLMTTNYCHTDSTVLPLCPVSRRHRHDLQTWLQEMKILITKSAARETVSCDTNFASRNERFWCVEDFDGKFIKGRRVEEGKKKGREELQQHYFLTDTHMGLTDLHTKFGYDSSNCERAPCQTDRWQKDRTDKKQTSWMRPCSIKVSNHVILIPPCSTWNK